MNPNLEAVRATVMTHFPTLWPAAEAGLSTAATLLLADNSNPVALIYVGPPSAGKTTVVSMFDGATSDGKPLCYRSDKFTTAAFVSQSAKVSREELANVDLLPRIRHKVLLTPELSTTFRGKQDELAERFSTLTRILDGQGYTTDSGTHGKRGYTGDYLFAWLGATTPFDPIVWKVMAQLGSRMFFLVMDAVAEPTVEDLVSVNRQPIVYEEGLRQCREAIHQFLEGLFAAHGGVRGVQWKPEENAPHVLKGIARCAMLLATLRTPYNDDNPYEAESPLRANAVLYNMARGHALISGRTHLAMDDLPAIARVTLSSIPTRRRAVLLTMAEAEGAPLTVAQVEQATKVSRHTVEAVSNHAKLTPVIM
ncbi:MAG: hypothetical protein GDA67_15090 [Nitrospira sp. CR1.3]|nr:hypothetical protein [Nitrospira sp. CR1.3]